MPNSFFLFLKALAVNLYPQFAKSNLSDGKKTACRERVAMGERFSENKNRLSEDNLFGKYLIG
ncbi:MAG TPA: hypothetical protein DEP07_12825 [Brevibacillus sp.]|nr:hypothetical protein [Brevibacillus sp.]